MAKQHTMKSLAEWLTRVERNRIKRWNESDSDFMAVGDRFDNLPTITTLETIKEMIVTSRTDIFNHQKQEMIRIKKELKQELKGELKNEFVPVPPKRQTWRELLIVLLQKKTD